MMMNKGPDQVLPATSFSTCEADGATIIPMSDTGPGSEPPISVYSLLSSTSQEHPDTNAMAVKRNGEWMYWTYAQYFKESCIVAKALIKLGLERFHGVCIMGFNSPEWFMANIGCIFAGGLSAGVYTTNAPEACRHVADNCNAQVVFVEDEISLNKFLSVKRFLPQLKAIIQWSGVPKAAGILSWAELIAIGMHESDDALKQRLSLQAVNQCCTLIYTSGTTGPPKGVMCSQDQLTWVAKRYYGLMESRVPQEKIVSYLPLSHLAGQMTDIFLGMVSYATVYFAAPDALKGSLGETLKEVRPTSFLGVPRIWEKIYEKMQEAGAQAGSFTKAIGNWAKYHGANYYHAIRDGRKLSTMELMKYSAARRLIHNKVKDALGLDQSNYFISGSAPISIDILEYFLSLGITISEGYALSESMSLGSFSKIEPHSFKFGSVGKVSPGMTIVLRDVGDCRDDEGEICIRGRCIAMGYLKMPEKTAETIDETGLLRSGDIGRFDNEGFLYITGRLKELIITAGGENIPPVLIETLVKKELPCISNCMLIGDKRKYLTMLLTLKCEVEVDTAQPLDELLPSVVEWLSSLGFAAVTVSEVVKEVTNKPFGAVAMAIEDGIQRYNRQATSNAQKIQKWHLLPHDFSLPTGELNNTLKLKRSYVLEKYKGIIDSMYAGDKLPSKL